MRFILAVVIVAVAAVVGMRASLCPSVPPFTLKGVFTFLNRF